jgi:hypothetical protein
MAELRPSGQPRAAVPTQAVAARPISLLLSLSEISLTLLCHEAHDRAIVVNK